jgi:hypothetical protein
MTSTTTSTTSVSSVAAALVTGINATAAVMGPADQVHSAPSEPIFLQTKLAQGIAGVFVWAALFVTCTQVSPWSGADVGAGKTGGSRRQKRFDGEQPDGRKFII